jgi:hypothetical protein
MEIVMRITTLARAFSIKKLKIAWPVMRKEIFNPCGTVARYFEVGPGSRR